jgi:leucine dehydrogenase
MPFEAMRVDGHEHVSFVSDADAGLRAIVAIHDTSLGPALGGTRLLPYPSEDAALEDVLRLSRGMTYKAAAADLALGGGKAVILGDGSSDPDERLLRAYGRAVDTLGGTYITTEDMNTTVAHMDVVAETTDHVVGTTAGLGDPSPVTAAGVVHGMRACLEHRYGDPSLDDVRVVVQGVGKVGGDLAERLVAAGAAVTIADPDPAAREAVAAAVDGEVDVVPVEDALSASCEVFAPCARSHLGTGDAESLRDAIPGLGCDIVAGSANNALGDHAEATEFARRLEDRGVLYAPDYVVNAGGLILMDHDRRGSAREAAVAEAAGIRDRLATVFERAEDEGISPLAAANRYAEARFQ